MIYVHVGEHNLLHIARADTERAQLRANLLFGLEPERDFPSEERMPGPHILKQMHCLSGVDDDDGFRVFDCPRIGRQPAGPVLIGEYGQLPPESVPASFNLRGLYFNGPGLDGVDT